MKKKRMQDSRPKCDHRGGAVQVGDYEILAGGVSYLEPQDIVMLRPDILVPLTQHYPAWMEEVADVHPLFLPDFGGVPPDWSKQVQQVIELLESGERVMAFCFASHGRTGTLLASLISVLEPEVDDPVEEVRKRHCSHSVETRAQAAAVFALRGQELPLRYSTLL